MSDNRWIIWQNACDATIHKILNELRVHFRSKAVIPHTETLDLLEEFDRPEMPNHTIDIDSEVPPTLEQLPATKVVKDFRTIIEEKDKLIDGQRTAYLDDIDKANKIIGEKDKLMQRAINEIGVPCEDYPANIANAYEILNGEHDTDSEFCWCDPDVRVMENGSKVIIHKKVYNSEL